MQYLFLVGRAPDSDTLGDASDDDPLSMEIDDWVDQMDGRGVRKFGDALRPSAESTTVRRRNGETLVTDGPFTEGKEYIVGFDLIDCADLDEAIEIASKHPQAADGLIEIRPIWVFD